MPTGYTADVQSGKVTEFREYALQCARAFGALVHMRDDPANVPIPTEIKPDDYYVKALAESRERLVWLQSLTDEQCSIEAAKAHSEALAHTIERRAETKAEQERYRAMLAKVEAWNPPTPDHVNMKKFMIEQLTDSMKFDDMTDYYANDPVPLAGAEWREKQIAEAQDWIQRRQKSHDEECQRATERTGWIKELLASL